MVNMVNMRLFACRCAEGYVVLDNRITEEHTVNFTKMSKSKVVDFFLLGKRHGLRDLMISPGAPGYSAGHSKPPSYSSVLQRLQSILSGPSTPTIFFQDLQEL
ncbi:hypothetical protein Tco_0680384 [Tanacetum coccineum]|uniref:Uncharacterized protein n=1 Tax=Tanacetum coccineum TaxID=301880 RepID=A0ABQ4XKD1_9ASTR